MRVRPLTPGLAGGLLRIVRPFRLVHRLAAVFSLLLAAGPPDLLGLEEPDTSGGAYTTGSLLFSRTRFLPAAPEPIALQHTAALRVMIETGPPAEGLAGPRRRYRYGNAHLLQAMADGGWLGERGSRGGWRLVWRSSPAGVWWNGRLHAVKHGADPVPVPPRLLHVAIVPGTFVQTSYGARPGGAWQSSGVIGWSVDLWADGNSHLSATGFALMSSRSQRVGFRDLDGSSQQVEFSAERVRGTFAGVVPSPD